MKLPVYNHTFLSTYENCPRQAWHKYVAKDLPPEAKSPEMLEGIRVHDHLQAEMNRGDNLDPRYVEFTKPLLEADAIRHYEWKCAIAASGTPVDFWSPLAWFRGVLDVALVAPPHAMIVDWKTGKPREDTAELDRFSFLLTACYPGVDAVCGSYVWLKTNTMGPLHELNPIRALERTRELALEIESSLYGVDHEWEAKPSGLCYGWCPVKTCVHWKDKK